MQKVCEAVPRLYAACPARGARPWAQDTWWGLVFQLAAIIVVVLVFGVSAMGQNVSVGLGGGITYLGGLRETLGVEDVSALSGGVFMNFDAGVTHINFAAHFAFVEDMTVSSFETNLLWFFPFKVHRFFIGGGSGVVGLPEHASSGLNLSFQAIAGLEYVLLKPLSLRFSAQALQVVRLNTNPFSGGPIYRIDVGLALPFGVQS